MFLLASQIMTGELQSSATFPKTTTDLPQVTPTTAPATSDVFVSVEGPQQPAVSRLSAQEEGDVTAERERNWVEVQRKKKSSRIEGKVRLG